MEYICCSSMAICPCVCSREFSCCFLRFRALRATTDIKISKGLYQRITRKPQAPLCQSSIFPPIYKPYRLDHELMSFGKTYRFCWSRHSPWQCHLASPSGFLNASPSSAACPAVAANPVWLSSAHLSSFAPRFPRTRKLPTSRRRSLIVFRRKSCRPSYGFKKAVYFLRRSC